MISAMQIYEQMNIRLHLSEKTFTNPQTEKNK